MKVYKLLTGLVLMVFASTTITGCKNQTQLQNSDKTELTNKDVEEVPEIENLLPPRARYRLDKKSGDLTVLKLEQNNIKNNFNALPSNLEEEETKYCILCEIYGTD